MRSALIALLLASPAVAQDTHLAEMDGIRILHAWTAATDAADTLVYMEIENTGDGPLTLMGAESDIAAQAALVGFRLVEGQPSYAVLPQLPVAAGTEMVLAPNGVAVRLTGLNTDLHKGDEFGMELHTSAGHIDLYVQVEPKGAKQHSHAGHNH